MKQIFLATCLLGTLVACGPRIPDSAAGVGFDTAAAAQRDAQLARSPGQPPVVTRPAPVTTTPVVTTLTPAAQPLPGEVTAAVNGTDPVPAAPQVPANTSNPAISSEQDFESVSAQRTIESDAQRIANNRAQYQVITPKDLPTRPGSNQPNIVAYALQTNNPPGTQIYRRTNLRSAQRHAAICARFASPDIAQAEFLSKGGPQRDRAGLDPDGDGYACTWDPTPFRAARAAAIAPVEETPAAEVVEPLVISTE